MEGGSEVVVEEIMEKVKEVMMWVENLGGLLLKEVEKAFPKLRHWVQVAGPFIILGLALLLLYCCLSCCCRRLCRLGGRSGRMMKAPGRGGTLLIRRSGFESDPSAYFRDLHARR